MILYLLAAWKEQREHGCFIPSCLLSMWSFRWCLDAFVESQNVQDVLIFRWVVLTCCFREPGNEALNGHSSHGYLIQSCFVAMCCLSLWLDIYSFSHCSHLCAFIAATPEWMDSLCWVNVLLDDPWKVHWEQGCFMPSCLLSMCILRWLLDESFASHSVQETLMFCWIVLTWRLRY